MTIGTPEVLLCLVIALLVLGPEKLPQAARTLGRLSREVKKFTSDVQSQVQGFIEDEDPDGPTKKYTPYNASGDPQNASIPTDPDVTPPSTRRDTDGFRIIDAEASAPKPETDLEPQPQPKSPEPKSTEQKPDNGA